jgi:hypothetical protein
VNVNAVDRFHQTALQEALAHRMHRAADTLRAKGGVIVQRDQGHALCAAAAKVPCSHRRQAPGW